MWKRWLSGVAVAAAVLCATHVVAAQGASGASSLLATCKTVVYGAKGDCERLYAYMSKGGQDPLCVDFMQQAMKLDEKIEQLKSLAENKEPSRSTQQAEISKLVAQIQNMFNMGCQIPVPLPDGTPFLAKPAIDAVVDQIRFGPDAGQYDALKARYKAASAARTLLSGKMRALLRSASTNLVPNVSQQINATRDEFMNNLAELTSIRSQARAVIVKNIGRMPGVAPDHGIDQILNGEFPPVGQ